MQLRHSGNTCPRRMVSIRRVETIIHRPAGLFWERSLELALECLELDLGRKISSRCECAGVRMYSRKRIIEFHSVTYTLDRKQYRLKNWFWFLWVSDDLYSRLRGCYQALVAIQALIVNTTACIKDFSNNLLAAEFCLATQCV